MLEKLDFPNAFYDFIVFVGSSLVFAVGLYVGIGGPAQNLLGGLGTFEFVWVLVALIFFGYEYGRIAEAWSYWMVQRPLAFISRHTLFLKNPDFLAETPDEEVVLHLPSFAGARKKNKWTLFFYASLVNPSLGSDLLKRYAWEKLSRNSAFTFCVLLLVSIASGILIHYQIIPPFIGNWTFGTLELGLALGTLTFMTYLEYYQRNCWNNDLLIKVLPVLMRAEELLREAKKSIP